jgi:hypothetical protein
VFRARLETNVKSILIAYDLIGTNETSEDYRRLIARIKEYPYWAKVEYATFIVKTDLTCVQVRANLDRFLDANDRIFVAQLTRSSASPCTTSQRPPRSTCGAPPRTASKSKWARPRQRQFRPRATERRPSFSESSTTTPACAQPPTARLGGGQKEGKRLAGQASDQGTAVRRLMAGWLDSARLLR